MTRKKYLVSPDGDMDMELCYELRCRRCGTELLYRPDEEKQAVKTPCPQCDAVDWEHVEEVEEDEI